MNVIRRPDGFSLIELVFTLIIISVGLGSLYAVMHRGLDHMRIIGTRSYAVVAATSELEIVKALPKERVPENYSGPFVGEVDLSALADGKGVLRIEDYESSDGQLKKVTVTVTWTVAGRGKGVTLSTLVSIP